MARMTLVERTFAGRAQAERWFDCLRPTAWPYVWCIEDPRNRRWSVRALVEHHRLSALGVDSRPVRPPLDACRWSGDSADPPQSEPTFAPRSAFPADAGTGYLEPWPGRAGPARRQ